MTAVVVASAVGPFLFSLADALAGGYRVGFFVASGLAASLAVASLWADNPQRD